MIFKNNTEKILNFFFEEPYKEVYLRELAKLTSLSPYTIKQNLDKLVQEELITEIRKGKMRFFKANLSNPVLRHLKITYNIHKILKSNLISFLKKKIPFLSSIVLYGSVARGEDTKKSDLDFLIIGKKVNLNLSSFKKMLGREITLLIYKHSEWKKKALENKGFYQNIITDGIVLYGSMPVIE